MNTWQKDFMTKKRYNTIIYYGGRGSDANYKSKNIPYKMSIL